MKIVIATTSGFHLRHLARELIALRRDVTYLTYLPKFRIIHDGIPLERARSYFWRLQPWSTAALFRRLPGLQHQAVERMFELTDRALARDMPPCDVFIGLSAMTVECARAARRKYGAKIVLERGSRHVLSQNELVSGGAGRPLSKTYVDRELAGYEIADYIALPSEHAVESFVERGFDRSRLFKNAYGVDMGVFAPSPRPEGPTRLIYVGAWSFRKGCDVLEAMLAACPDLTLTHVGGRDDLEFPTLANFRSLGHRTHAELREVLGDHRILLLPSREDGFGMVLIEGLASGLAVIGSTKTGAPDLLELIQNKEAVRLVPPADMEALVGAIRNLSDWLRTQPLDRRILSDADKENLSWTAYARRYDDFLRAIV
ncbi:MAG TPA: glycosyltransferase family 4 protein [Methylocystis sp.]|nr:glycosyltransferase family 4 protein [Methylocystis sp.]